MDDTRDQVPRMSEQTRREIERGSRVVRTIERLKRLAPYSGHYSTVDTYDENDGFVTDFIVAGKVCARQRVNDKDYPSDTVVATIALAVRATVGDFTPAEINESEGAKPPSEETRAYWRRLGQWREQFDKPVTAPVKGERP